MPCIISWPGVIPSGARSDVVLSSLDFLPTLAGFAKAQVDKERRIDGMNAASQWKGESTDSPHEVFSYFHLGTLEAVRSGPWKLFVAKNRKQDFEPKLFHVLDDIGEEKDVASEHPEVVSRLTAMAEAVIADLGTATEDGPGTRPPGHVSEPVPLTRAR